MITTLTLVFDKSIRNYLPKKCKEFYIREEPSKVIEALKDTVTVCAFHRISTNRSQILKIGPDRVSGGVAVNYLHKASDSFELNNIRSFIDILPPIVSRLPDANDVLEDMISAYLMDMRIESNGTVLSGTTYLDMPKTEPKVLTRGIQSVVSYMHTRDRSKDQRREAFLKDIITYGRGILDKDFCEKDVKDISERVSAKFPISFNPLDGPSSFYKSSYR